METPLLINSVACGLAELVDADADTGCGAVGAPAMVGGVVGQWPAGAVDAGPKQWPVGVAGTGEVEVAQNVCSVCVATGRLRWAERGFGSVTMGARSPARVFSGPLGCSI